MMRVQHQRKKNICLVTSAAEMLIHAIAGSSNKIQDCTKGSHHSISKKNYKQNVHANDDSEVHNECLARMPSDLAWQTHNASTAISTSKYQGAKELIN